MEAKKIFTLTETGKAEILSINTCPICGAGRDNNIDRWGFISGCWNKAPLLCEHGYWFTENINTTDDADKDNWEESVLILPEYIPELEALGYTEA